MPRLLAAFLLATQPFVTATAASGAAAATSVAPPPAGARTEHVHARLVAERAALVPGAKLAVLLVLDIAPGWHTYWRNPGDSGEPTRLDWTLPSGYAAGPIAWPAPERLPIPPLANFGYKGRALHLVELAVPADATPGADVVLATRARWLVCADVCIPESAELALRLPVRAGGPAQAGQAAPSAGTVSAVDAAALFAEARARLPQPAPGDARVTLTDGMLALDLAPEWGAPLTGARDVLFFPHVEGAIEPAAPQSLDAAPGLRLTAKTGYLGAGGGLAALAPDGTLDGVLTASVDGRRVAWEVRATAVR